MPFISFKEFIFNQNYTSILKNNFDQLYQNICESTKLNKIFILEGGASGHMAHIFEDGSITFSDLRNIFTDLFKGNLSITEKTDGFALAITYKDGEIKSARNKKELVNPLNIEDIIIKYSTGTEHGEIVKTAFTTAMQRLSQSVLELPEDELNTIFNNGQNYMALEIISPLTKNVISYGDDVYLIQFHGINIYDEKFNKISEDKKSADRLYKELDAAGVLYNNIEKIKITGPAVLKIKNLEKSEFLLSKILDELHGIVDGYGFNTTLEEYVNKKLIPVVVNYASNENLDISSDSSFIYYLAQRVNRISNKKISIQQILVHAKEDPTKLPVDKVKNLIHILDNEQDRIFSEIIAPVENLVIRAGLFLMKNLSGYIGVSQDEEANNLTAELNKSIDEINDAITSGALTDNKKEQFIRNIEKLNRFNQEIVGAEGIVFLYNNKVYKITSTFGPLNQILGILKY